MIFDLTDHAEVEYISSTSGGEYAGECPWCGGNDRFRVWPKEGDTGRYWCRKCKRDGDGIDFLRKVKDMTFQDACKKAHCEYKLDEYEDEKESSGEIPDSEYPRPKEEKKTTPPPDRWQVLAASFAEMCEDILWGDDRKAYSGRKYLFQDRNFESDTIQEFGIGLNTEDRYYDPDDWGLDRGEDSKLWIPRGIVIPWIHENTVWGMNVRRPDGDVREDNFGKYHRIMGTKNALYNADKLKGGPAILVEGEFDAVAIHQESDRVVPVATGSTHWGRTQKWLSMIRQNTEVLLVSYDNNDAGEDAARFWLREIDWSVRWYPKDEDPAETLSNGDDVDGWVEAGLSYASTELKSVGI